MKREPILIRCEGSGAANPWCPMCAIAADVYGIVPEHNRRDILAELQRGDFGQLDDDGTWHDPSREER